MSNKVLKKVNKIKSIREVLDFNGDGKVDKDELIEGKNNPNVMSKIKDISPMTYFLIKNQKLKVKTNIKKHTNIDLIRKSRKSYQKDKNIFNTKFS